MHVTPRHLLARRAILGGAGVFLSTLLGAILVTTVFADDQTDTETMLTGRLTIPYQGFIMLDSAPLQGQHVIKFDLYNEEAGGSSLWTSTRVIEVQNGRFNVALGEQEDLNSVLLTGDQLWVGMTIIEATAGGAITQVDLTGRQALDVTPYAAWAGRAKDLDIQGMLSVASNKTLTIVGSSVVTGSLHITGPENTGSTAALTLKRAFSTNTLYMDSNEIDFDGTFNLQQSSGNAVEAHNELSTHKNTVLGDDYSDATILYGTDNTGTTAALIVKSSNTQSLYIDGNEIDSSAGLPLGLNVTNKSDVSLGADLQLKGNYTPSYSTWDGNDTGSRGAAIVNDNNVYKALMIVGNDSGGDRRVEVYDDLFVPSDITVVNGATYSGGVDLSSDLTVTGTLTRTTNACPGSAFASVYSSKSKERLCIYNYRDSSNTTDWNDASDVCWNTYGAELCTVNQIRIALERSAMSLNNDENSNSGTRRRWLRDRVSDNYGTWPDGTTASNFDVSPDQLWSDNESGALCCRMIHGY